MIFVPFSLLHPFIFPSSALHFIAVVTPVSTSCTLNLLPCFHNSRSIPFLSDMDLSDGGQLLSVVAADITFASLRTFVGDALPLCEQDRVRCVCVCVCVCV